MNRYFNPENLGKSVEAGIDHYKTLRALKKALAPSPNHHGATYRTSLVLAGTLGAIAPIAIYESASAQGPNCSDGLIVPASDSEQAILTYTAGHQNADPKTLEVTQTGAGEFCISEEAKQSDPREFFLNSGQIESMTASSIQLTPNLKVTRHVAERGQVTEDHCLALSLYALSQLAQTLAGQGGKVIPESIQIYSQDPVVTRQGQTITSDVVTGIVRLKNGDKEFAIVRTDPNTSRPNSQEGTMFVKFDPDKKVQLGPRFKPQSGDEAKQAANRVLRQHGIDLDNAKDDNNSCRSGGPPNSNAQAPIPVTDGVEQKNQVPLNAAVPVAAIVLGFGALAIGAAAAVLIRSKGNLRTA